MAAGTGTIACAISGETPTDPVFCSTGYVFERGLIEKHIEAQGKCPLSGADITKDDLQPIKINKGVVPRPLNATSIPGMLQIFQTEWDSVMSETCELKKHLDTIRQQLSHTLYQHDAACRVIARLMKQRDEARAQVGALQQQLASARAGSMQAAPEAEGGFGPEILARMQEKSKVLAKGRKGRQFPGLTAKEAVAKLACVSSHPIHQSTAPGINCVAVHKEKAERIATGGVDCNVVLFNAQTKEAAQKLKGHSKAVNAVQLHPTRNVVVSASQDTTARVWVSSVDGQWDAQHKCTYVAKVHKAAVTGVSVHPVDDYFATGSLDKSWALHDLNMGRCLLHVNENTQCQGYNHVAFHPDGLILGAATTDGVAQIWDLKAQVVAAQLTGHEGEVTCLSFSENGYYLATSSKDCCVKLWDLRKPINFQTITLDGKQAVNSVQFDLSGNYLALCTDKVEVCHFEGKTSVASTCTLTDHTGPVMGLSWGPLAGSLVTVGTDRMVKLYQPA
jgi:pre-mRNA-processing factor 19